MQPPEQITLPNQLAPSLLLLVLTKSRGHGGELCERLQSAGLAPGHTSQVHRYLLNLEGAGLVRTTLTRQERGAPRRVYELTAEGRVALDRSLPNLRALRDALGDLLAAYTDPGRT